MKQQFNQMASFNKVSPSRQHQKMSQGSKQNRAQLRSDQVSHGVVLQSATAAAAHHQKHESMHVNLQSKVVPKQQPIVKSQGGVILIGNSTLGMMVKPKEEQASGHATRVGFNQDRSQVSQMPVGQAPHTEQRVYVKLKTEATPSKHQRNKSYIAFQSIEQSKRHELSQSHLTANDGHKVMQN